MKIFTASLLHETNAFSPLPTNLDSYREMALCLPSTGEGLHLRDSPFEGVNIAALARARGHEVVESVLASAEPSAPTRRTDYELLRDEILATLERALPVDAVMLFLHGAQMAEGYDDCEGDLAGRVRALVGPDVPVGAEIDPHGNISAAMIEHLSILVSLQEYPHIDFVERAEHLLDLLEQAHADMLDPVMAFARVPMFGSYFTMREPMRGFVDRALAAQGKGGIASVSLIHGFPWSDTPDAGAGVLVVADGDVAGAEVLAGQLAQEFFALRGEITEVPPGVEDALGRALAAPCRPVVVADTTDNPGGGAPGDSTHILRFLLEHDARDVALGMLWDPAAVALARSAGEGATLPLRIGGKMGPLSGPPLDVTATVLRLRDDATQVAQGRVAPLGPGVALRVGGIDIVLNSIRQQVFSPECFTAFGIDPQAKRIVVVKSNQHFYETFGPWAAETIYAAPPGVVQRDFRTLPFTRVSRPVWPIDPLPFHAHGRDWT